MKTFEAIFEVTRTYKVEIEAEDQDSADKRADDIPTDEIEIMGAGHVHEEVEIVSIKERS